MGTGSNHIYTTQSADVIISISVHGNRDLPTGTFKSIMKDARLSEDDL
jgi:predicted RNA binding protein YcfA (HicA-like mRNA interferase family)